MLAVINPACTCQYWRMTSGEYSRASQEERHSALRAQLEESPAPGLLAYVDGDAVGSSPGSASHSLGAPVGWVGFGPRERMGRLVRSRTIPKVDDVPVWSITCFTVRVGFRRQGIARALLDGVIEYAREQGAPALEAYPVDTAGRRIHGTAAYVGTAGMFERAGFRRIVETGARSDHLPRWLMRLELGRGG